jgi:iron complex outermembrane recepter protein
MRTRRVTSRLHFLVAIFVALASLVASSAAIAGVLDRVIVFNIAAQTLDKALLEFGAQAHVQISFAWDSTKASVRTQALKGSYTGREALAELLEGTGLRYVAHQQTVEILPKVSSHPPTLPTRESRAQLGRNTLRTLYDDDVKHDGPPARQSKAKRPALQEVVVTGSRLRTTDKEGPQEVQTYDSKYIDQSGQNSVSDFLATLPSVSLSSQSTAFGVGTTVTLRGLPVGTTLVLLNGRSLEASGLANWVSGQQFFDLNNIPLAAIQRIEVEENGASAVYGSDAIAGVVNIILKKDFNGFEANARYGWEKDSQVLRTNLAWGRQWARGGFSLIGTYGTDGGLLNTERLLSASNDYTNFGGPDNNYPVCSPGNVFSTTGAPLPGAPLGSDASYAAITGHLASGRPTFSQFTYGALNQCSFISGTSLLPASHHAAVLLQGDLQIAPTIELFTEVIYSTMTQFDSTGYQSLFGLPSVQLYTVSAGNPFNPFGTTVGIAESLHDVPTGQDYSTDFFRPLVGIKGTVAQRWQWEVSAWQSSDWTQDRLPNLVPDAIAIQSALNSSDPATALNPFVTGPIASPSLLQTLFTSGNIKWMGRDRSAEAYMRGPVVRLPAGDAQGVIGVDYVQSTLEFNDINDGVDPPNTRQQYQQEHSAAFVEARIPLAATQVASHSRTVLALTAAGRHDQYSEVGAANTEQVGLEFRPTDGLLIRGTYGTAFEAPPLTSLFTPETVTPALVTDPVTGAPALVNLTTGGNPHLQPMTGQSHTIGAMYSSDDIPGLLLSITDWQVIENNAIQSVSPQVIVDNENVFSDRVVRNSSGDLVEVIDTAVNFGSIDVAGLDYQLAYRHRIGPGNASLDFNVTQTYRYDQALVPGTPSLEVVSEAQDDQDWAPRWKGVVGFGWQQGAATAHLDGRYTGSYTDYDSTRVIGNFWMVDADLRVDLGSWLGWKRDWLRNYYLEFGATNLFNRAPQFSNFLSDFYGYDAAEMSIVGRSLYVQLGVGW